MPDQIAEPVDEEEDEAIRPDADQQWDLLADSDQAKHGKDGDQCVDHNGHHDLEVLHGVCPQVVAEDGHRVGAPKKIKKRKKSKETSLYFSSTPSTSSALSTAHCLLLMM